MMYLYAHLDVPTKVPIAILLYDTDRLISKGSHSSEFYGKLKKIIQFKSGLKLFLLSKAFKIKFKGNCCNAELPQTKRCTISFIALLKTV